MAELTQRLLYRQSIETARCLAEGVLTSTHDANIGSIFGIGFPGLDRRRDAVHLLAKASSSFFANAERLAARHGERFAAGPDVRSAAQHAACRRRADQ